jgi:hypothetical protein
MARPTQSPQPTAAAILVLRSFLSLSAAGAAEVLEGGDAMTIIELLGQVHDRESFLKFAYAFAEDRRRVESIEAADPEGYQWGGAEGWNNNCISLFIEGGLSHFEPVSDRPDIENPTWKDLAEFLWCGKCIE